MRAALIEGMLERVRARRPFALVTEMATGAGTLVADAPGDGEVEPGLAEAVAEAMHTDVARVVESEGGPFFVEPFNPRVRMVVVGAVHIAQPLLEMAGVCGLDTVVVDPRDAWATRERFPSAEVLRRWPGEALEEIGVDSRTAVVALTHDPKIDDDALAVALRSPAFYIGALGSRRTHGRRVARLSEEGFSEEDCGRIHAPIGLDIGASSAAEIALAVMAEVVACARRPGASR